MDTFQRSIFKELMEDHQTQRDLLKHIVETSGKTKEREKLLGQLELALKKHAKYEERYFYRPLLNSDITQENARHSISEHEEIDQKLEDLKDANMSHSSWLFKAKELKDLVEHHLDEEENEIFASAGRVLDHETKYEYAKTYKDQMQDIREETQVSI